MAEPLDLEPIKDRQDRTRKVIGDVWSHRTIDALVAEVEQLRDEADSWRDSTHHLSKVRAREGREVP